MKRFVFRMVLFLMIPFLLLGSWTAFVVIMDRRSYIGSLVIPQECDVAVCSDSQTRDGLNPEFMPRLYNFSASAAHPDQNLLRLKDLLKRNKGRLRYVLLDVTPIHVGFDERALPLSESGSARVHALLHMYHWIDAERPIGSVVKLFRDVILVRKFHEFRKALKRGIPYRSSLAGGFYTVKTAGFIDNPEKAHSDMVEKSRRFNQKLPFSKSSRIAYLMRESVRVVRDAGAEPIFMTTPLSPRLKASFNQENVRALTNGVATLAREMELHYMNYFSLNLSDEYWRDANHLNLAGSEVFTRLVSEDIVSFCEKKKSQLAR